MKRIYITPNITSIVIQQPLLETVSGKDQGGGYNEDRPIRSKDAFFEYDFDFDDEIDY